MSHTDSMWFHGVSLTIIVVSDVTVVVITHFLPAGAGGDGGDPGSERHDSSAGDRPGLQIQGETTLNHPPCTDRHDPDTKTPSDLYKMQECLPRCPVAVSGEVVF